jgi:putative colanic acid biosynthesis acetyltransferase WcaF
MAVGRLAAGLCNSVMVTRSAQNSPAKDPYLAPAFSFGNRLRRAIWGILYVCFFRSSPRPLHEWRSALLRLMGAKLGSNCHIYPKSRIWAPWNLICGEQATIADGAVIYNPEPVRLGSHAIVSQEAYLCGATHDYEDPAFPLIAFPISLGEYSWICARATVQSGVNVGDGAVLALGSIATKDLEPWTVYGGVPARKLKRRELRSNSECATSAH